MKKTIGIVLICAALLLSACGEGASVQKEPERTPAAETTAPVPATDRPAQETPAPATERPVQDPSTSVVAAVELVRQDEGDAEAVRICGRNAAGETVWQREFRTEYRTELTLIEEIGLWQDRYLFNNNGTVTCLRLKDGETVWENDEFGGASISALIDQRNGNVYLCGWYGPAFFAVDGNGNTLSCYHSLEDDFYWPGEMSWSDANTLEILYHGGPEVGMGEDGRIPYYVDLTDFSISYRMGRIELDNTARYWAAIFLSDFIEQNWTSFDLQTASDLDLLEFAHRFCKINRQEAIAYEGEYETVRLEDVNALTRRFFGRSLDPQEGILRSEANGLIWKYEGGKFYFPAADGESYNHFAVVREAWWLPNDRLRFRFDVYELNLEEYFDRGMDSGLYRLSAAEAETLAGQGRITKLGTGTAEALSYPPDAARQYSMPAGADGYWMLRLETDF